MTPLTVSMLVAFRLKSHKPRPLQVVCTPSGAGAANAASPQPRQQRSNSSCQRNVNPPRLCMCDMLTAYRGPVVFINVLSLLLVGGHRSLLKNVHACKEPY
jgi:hypothetical protein